MKVSSVHEDWTSWNSPQYWLVFGCFNRKQSLLKVGLLKGRQNPTNHRHQLKHKHKLRRQSLLHHLVGLRFLISSGNRLVRSSKLCWSQPLLMPPRAGATMLKPSQCSLPSPSLSPNASCSGYADVFILDRVRGGTYYLYSRPCHFWPLHPIMDTSVTWLLAVVSVQDLFR